MAAVVLAADSGDTIAADGGAIQVTPVMRSSVQIEYGGKVMQVDPVGKYNNVEIRVVGKFDNLLRPNREALMAKILGLLLLIRAWRWPKRQMPATATPPTLKPVGTVDDLMVGIIWPISDEVFYITTRDTPKNRRTVEAVPGKDAYACGIRQFADDAGPCLGQ